MTRFTNAAYYALQNLAYSNPSTDRAQTAVDDALGLDLDDDQFDLMIRRDRHHGMLGVAAVKDLRGNNHFITSRRSDNSGTHAEEALFDSISAHFSNSAGKLTSAKVYFYMQNSPCKNCTKNILAWCRTCANNIGIKGTADNGIYFVFNFAVHYLKGKTDKQDTFWGSYDEANTAYAEVTKRSGTTAPLLCRKSGGRYYRYPRISFRWADKKIVRLAKIAA